MADKSELKGPDTQMYDELRARVGKAFGDGPDAVADAILENYAVNPLDRQAAGEVPFSVMGGHDRRTGDAVVAIRLGTNEVRMPPAQALSIARGIKVAVEAVAPDAEELPDISTMFEAVNHLVGEEREGAVEALLTTLDQQGKIMGSWLRKKGFAEAAEALLTNNARASANLLDTLGILRKAHAHGPIATA
jgi:hypothetical protein